MERMSALDAAFFFKEPTMTRQIALGYQPPQTAALEARIEVLEARVAALTRALQVLSATSALRPQDEQDEQEEPHRDRPLSRPVA